MWKISQYEEAIKNENALKSEISSYFNRVNKLQYRKNIGNWKNLLDNDEIQEIKKLSGIKGIKKTKDFIRRELKELIRLPDVEFEKRLSENTDLFEENDFNVYSNEQENFQALLHKKEAYTLLEILENTET